MKVAFITPVNLMTAYAARGGLVFVLAHEYLRNNAYAQRVLDFKDAGLPIIMDNGAYEYGESVEKSDLVIVAKEIEPDLLVAPDIRFDMKATLDLAKATVQELGALSGKVLAVPQGADLKEVIVAYQALDQLEGVDGFGIYSEIGDVSGLGPRVQWLAYIARSNIVSREKYHHMLGMESNLHELKFLPQFTWVDSVDSCKPIVMGLNGVSVHDSHRVPYPHRPTDYFNLKDNPYHAVLEANVQTTVDWVKAP